MDSSKQKNVRRIANSFNEYKDEGRKIIAYSIILAKGQQKICDKSYEYG